MWLPDVHTLPLTTLPPLTSQGCDVGTAGKLPHQLGDSGGRKAPGGPEVWWGPPFLPAFLSEGSKAQPPLFQLKTFMRKYKKGVFCMQGSGALSKQETQDYFWWVGKWSTRGLYKKKTKQENLDSSFFSLLLLCQSHSGCLLTDRTEEVERTVGRV